MREGQSRKADPVTSLREQQKIGRSSSRGNGARWSWGTGCECGDVTSIQSGGAAKASERAGRTRESEAGSSSAASTSRSPLSSSVQLRADSGLSDERARAQRVTETSGASPNLHAPARERRRAAQETDELASKACAHGGRGSRGLRATSLCSTHMRGNDRDGVGARGHGEPTTRSPFPHATSPTLFSPTTHHRAPCRDMHSSRPHR